MARCGLVALRAVDGIDELPDATDVDEVQSVVGSTRLVDLERSITVDGGLAGPRSAFSTHFHERRNEIDPDTCFSMILENISDEAWCEAADNAENLRTWLNKGGFPPGGGKLSKTSIDALIEWLISHRNRDD